MNAAALPGSSDTAPFIAVTGGTGLLGSYLVRDLLVAGRNVALVVRRDRKRSAATRVEAVVRHWEETLETSLPRPVVLEGDLAQPFCGLAEEDRQWLHWNCSALLHNAASLSFRGADRAAEPWLTNVTGTAHAIDLARAADIEHFHHVSTAYVCGLREGTVLEDDLDVGQPFGNDYETSKCAAEKMVREAGFESATVYRPSIIVGDSETGYTSTYHGFFAGLRLGHTLLTRVAKGSTSGPALLALIGVNQADRKNFVPVDWVSAVIAHAVQTPGARGRTYHLTHPDPLSMRTVGRIIQEAVETFSVAASPDDPDRCDERWFADNLRSQLDVYQSYFRNDPVFDRRHTESLASHLPCPPLDDPTLLRMSQFAIECNFGRRPTRATSPSGVAAS